MKHHHKQIIAALFFIVATVIAINSIEDDAIVRVNKLKISDTLFKSKYKQFLNDNYLADNMLNRYALMNSLIDSLLILNHAEEIGLYKNRSVVKDEKDAYDQLLLNEFFESVITIEKDIDEEELRKFFIWKNTTFRIRHLFAHNINQMDSIVARLKSGDKWMSIANDIFQDPRLRENGGELGWVNLGDLEPVFELRAFLLEPNQISEPIKTKSGYSLVQMMDKRKNGFLLEKDFELEKIGLSSLIKHYRRQIYLQKYMERKEKELGISFNDNSIQSAYYHFFSISEISETDLNSTLVEFKGGQWTVNDAMYRVEQLSKTQHKQINSLPDLKDAITGLICRADFVNGAKKLKIHESGTFKNKIAGLKNKIILRSVLDEIYSKVDREDPHYIQKKKTMYLQFRKKLFEKNKVTVDSLLIKTMIIS